MLTLLASLLGLLGSAIPDVFKIFKDKRDKTHELEIMKLQIEQQKQGSTQRLEEINTNADIAELSALYQTYHTGVTWVDAFNGTVRPVLAYSFFLLYAAVKILTLFSLFDVYGHSSVDVYAKYLWTEEDQAIFAGVIAFYFGQRSFSKLRQGK